MRALRGNEQWHRVLQHARGTRSGGTLSFGSRERLVSPLSPASPLGQRLWAGVQGGYRPRASRACPGNLDRNQEDGSLARRPKSDVLVGCTHWGTAADVPKRGTAQRARVSNSPEQRPRTIDLRVSCVSHVFSTAGCLSLRSADLAAKSKLCAVRRRQAGVKLVKLKRVPTVSVLAEQNVAVTRYELLANTRG